MNSAAPSPDQLLLADRRAREGLRIIEQLRAAGFVAYFAGGCVRDALLGKHPQDYDVATDATPTAVREVFGKRNTLAFGASFGVIGVLPKKKQRREDQRPPVPIEVATFRSDAEYSDGRRPDAVHFGTAEADAQRRDFTINGMFYDPLAKRVIDYVGGQQDLHDRVLRTIGDAHQRFAEDKLRMLRAVRFATVLGFRKDAATFDAIRQHAASIGRVSGERIGAEMRKVLVAPAAVAGLEQLRATDLARFIWPSLAEVDLDAMRHTLAKLHDRCFPHSFPAALACVCLATDSPAASLADVAQRWRLSKDETRAAAAAIEHWPALAEAAERPWSRVQPVLVHRDVDTILAVADAQVLSRAEVAQSATRGLERAREALQWPTQQLDPPPLLTGDDLKQLGLPAGPQYREILQTVRDAQLDGRLTDRDEALRKAKEVRSLESGVRGSEEGDAEEEEGAREGAKSAKMKRREGKMKGREDE